MLVKACERVGFDSTLLRFDESITEDELVAEVNKINKDANIDGLIVQLPLPSHINEMTIIKPYCPQKMSMVSSSKHRQNGTKLPTFLYTTPAGIVELIKRYNIDTEGKHCVVVGRSHIVGSPMSILMARNSYPGNSTVTLTHSRTTNLKNYA